MIKQLTDDARNQESEALRPDRSRKHGGYRRVECCFSLSANQVSESKQRSRSQQRGRREMIQDAVIRAEPSSLRFPGGAPFPSGPRSGLLGTDSFTSVRMPRDHLILLFCEIVRAKTSFWRTHRYMRIQGTL